MVKRVWASPKLGGMRTIEWYGQQVPWPENTLAVETRAVAPGINLNYDEFTPDALEASAPSFEGCPVYVDHVYQLTDSTESFWPDGMDRSRSRGQVGAWHLDENDVLSLLIFVDKKWEQLCQALLSGAVNSVSMGCECDTYCSVCGKLFSDDAPCAHCPQLIGMPTDDGPVHDVLERIRFTEISFVFDPAEPSALIWDVLDD